MSAKSRGRRRAKQIVGSTLLQRLIAANQNQTEDYPNREAAQDAMMLRLRNEEFHDNFRFAFIDDADQMRAYEASAANGCCGACDLLVTVSGQAAVIGCNYGH